MALRSNCETCKDLEFTSILNGLIRGNTAEGEMAIIFSFMFIVCCLKKLNLFEKNVSFIHCDAIRSEQFVN